MRLYEYCDGDCENCDIEDCKYREDEDDDYWEGGSSSYYNHINKGV